MVTAGTTMTLTRIKRLNECFIFLMIKELLVQNISYLILNSD